MIGGAEPTRKEIADRRDRKETQMSRPIQTAAPVGRSMVADAHDSAISHDLFASVIAKGKLPGQREVRISQITAVVIGIVVIFLGYVFQNENVAFMVDLAFVVAASCNFPALLISGAGISLRRAPSNIPIDP